MLPSKAAGKVLGRKADPDGARPSSRRSLRARVHDGGTRPILKAQVDVNDRVTCPSCGRPTATAVKPSEYHYSESGIPGLRLRGGVTLTSCARCKKSHVLIEKEGQLLQAIACRLLMKPGPLTGPEMRFIRRACQMSQAKLAAELKLDRRETISERERKRSPGLDFATEIGLRALFLGAFNDFLGEEGNSVLSRSQRKRLAEFTELFTELRNGFAASPTAVDIVRFDVHGDWELAKAA